MTARRAVLLDRDGVINELVARGEDGVGESPLHPDEVALVPGVVEGLERLKESGYLLACVTNQPAAAKGEVALDVLERTHKRVIELLDESAIHLDAYRICFHHPQGTHPELSGTCDCRKPAPGMLLEVARDLQVSCSTSWMVGDTDSDVLAGRAAGMRTVLVAVPLSGHKRNGAAPADITVPNFGAAVEILVQNAHEPG